MSSIGAIALQEVQKFRDDTFQLTTGDSFNQYETIQRIIKYTNNNFWECSDTNALFYQVANNRRALYAKSIDMNTKDYYTIGVGKTNWFQNWILNVRFKKWARDERFALTLDDVSSDIATFGSTVWKKVKLPDGTTSIEMCDLRNLYFDPTVKNIVDSPVCEMHYLTEMEIRNRWADKADEIIENAKKARDEEDNEAESHDDKYRIVERWGEYREYPSDPAKYYHYIGTGSGDEVIEIVMDVVKIDKKTGKPVGFPYYDFHGERVKGRWLGLGVVERLFDIQEQVNTLVNQNNEVNNIASLLLFRTQDPNTTGNILDAVENGQIISSEDMEEMNISNRFLQGFIAQLKMLEQKADELCYITESISGDTPPSGVPFRSMAMASRGSVSTFDYIKSAAGEKMGYILQEQILPSLVKGWNREKTIEISEDENDIRLYDQAIIKSSIEEYTMDRARNGYIVFQEDLAELAIQKRQELETTKRDEKIGKNFFDFEYGIVMNPTGESMDKNAINGAIDAAIAQMIAAPAVVNTPLFQQKLENNNIPPFRLSVEEQQELMGGTKPGAPLPEAPQDTLSSQAAI